MMRLLLTFFFILAFTATHAQSKKRKKGKENAAEYNQPNSLNPGFPTTEYGPKKTTRGSKKGITYDAEKRYFDRLELVARERRKGEKEMMKPQYSDPSYFGHKRPPKKRPARKMKFCKECGIRH